MNGATMAGATNASHTLVATPEGDGSKFTCLVRNEAGEVLSWAGLLEVEAAAQPFDGILLERYTRIPGGWCSTCSTRPTTPLRRSP
ncbi:MAG: hypothetical protein HS113_18190 [Verrucomicrobiales bacterium]|nr:hypothetical protein [Verrucomicrobiales bacterium]